MLRDNPKSIRGLHDLARKDCRFVNRQPGSRTRVLLDYELKRLRIDPASIHGYEREEFTHMAVGVAVASGLADAGLGVRAAAQALGLDFIPLANEQYDLLCLRPFYESAKRNTTDGNHSLPILKDSGRALWRLRSG